MEKSKKAIIAQEQDFLDWLDIEKGLASKSQENYSRFIKRFFVWLEQNNLQNIKPHELTPDHVWRYRVFLSRNYPSRTHKELKRSTQNYYLIALRALLSYFTAKDILSLPADKIQLAKGKKEREIKFLTLEQLKKLFSAPNTEAPHGLRDRAILELFFSSGMRIAELVSLNRDQFLIKTDTKELEIGIVGKGSRLRTVYVSERAIEWLRKYLNLRKDDEKALFTNFRTPPRRITARAIEKNIKKYAVLAGIPITTTPHVLRHSFATDLLAQGVDLRVVQEFLGHKSITATQIYAHVTSKQLRDIHRKYHGGKQLDRVGSREKSQNSAPHEVDN